MKYAIRGPIPQEADRLRREGKVIVPCNIGNPQQLGQKPLNLFRRVTALTDDESLLKAEIIDHDPNLRTISEVASSLARDILGKINEEQGSDNTGGTGPYSQSKGYEFVREAVARFIGSVSV
ncbi:hypothetical protein HYU06_06050 [Candidatus Woesearchaeota archaeon]|nr:hypothetical protein [Candidatus Woesearchaeota archaeon]